MYVLTVWLDNLPRYLGKKKCDKCKVPVLVCEKCLTAKVPQDMLVCPLCEPPPSPVPELEGLVCSERSTSATIQRELAHALASYANCTLEDHLVGASSDSKAAKASARKKNKKKRKKKTAVASDQDAKQPSVTDADNEGMQMPPSKKRRVDTVPSPGQSTA